MVSLAFEFLPFYRVVVFCLSLHSDAKLMGFLHRNIVHIFVYTQFSVCWIYICFNCRQQESQRSSLPPLASLWTTAARIYHSRVCSLMSTGFESYTPKKFEAWRNSRVLMSISIVHAWIVWSSCVQSVIWNIVVDLFWLLFGDFVCSPIMIGILICVLTCRKLKSRSGTDCPE